MQVLASLLDNISATALRDLDPDLYFSGHDTELRTYQFIRDHYDEHRVLPSRRIVRNNLRIELPELDADQPYDYYLKRVRQRGFTQALVEPYNEMQEGFQHPASGVTKMENAIDEMYQLRSRFLQRGTGIELSDTLIEQVMQEAEDRRFLGSTVNGVTTGYTPVDLAMDGYNKDDLVVWLGRPGRGKSWLLLNQCHAAWMAGYKPLYVSMEMGGIQNMRRLLGIHSGINPTFIKRGQIGTLAQPILDRAAAELLEARPLQMVTANFSRTVDQIDNFIEQHLPDIVYIDAGYLLSPKKQRYGSGGRRETISDVIEELKELGVNAGIPIVMTSQFNRQAEQRRRGSNQARRNGEAVEVDPISHLSLAEIGETDVIGQAASHVFGIEYPPYPIEQNRYRVFGFLKGREGESGWWATNYMPRQYSAVDMSILDRNDPVYAAIAATGNPTARDPSQRSAAMQIQD